MTTSQSVRISRDVMKLLEKAISQNRTLMALEFESCQIESYPSLTHEYNRDGEGPISNIAHISLWNCRTRMRQRPTCTSILQGMFFFINGCRVLYLLSHQHFISGFVHLTSVDMSNTDMSGAEVASLLQRLQSLRWLDIGSNDIGADYQQLNVACEAV